MSRWSGSADARSAATGSIGRGRFGAAVLLLAAALLLSAPATVSAHTSGTWSTLGAGSYPTVFGTRAAWLGEYPHDIIVYDTVSGSGYLVNGGYDPLRHGPVLLGPPSLSERYMVAATDGHYQDYTPDAVLLWDVSGPDPVFKGVLGSGRNPRVSGDWVAWDRGNGTLEVCRISSRAKKTIASSHGSIRTISVDSYPAWDLRGDSLVYAVGASDTDNAVYMYDLSTDTESLVGVRGADEVSMDDEYIAFDLHGTGNYLATLPRFGEERALSLLVNGCTHVDVENEHAACRLAPGIALFDCVTGESIVSAVAGDYPRLGNDKLIIEDGGAIKLLEMNQPPVATPDAFETPPLEGIYISAAQILGNDYDPDRDKLTLKTGYEGFAFEWGVGQIYEDGSVWYQPDLGGWSIDIPYTITDDDGATASGRITISPGYPPVAGEVAVSTVLTKPVDVTIPASDPDGGALTFSILSGPSHGTLSGISGGKVTYTGDKGYLGPDTFTFRASDGILQSNVGTVTIDVQPNHPPVANLGSMELDEDTSRFGSAPGGDPDGDVVTFFVTEGPTHGGLVFNADGSYTYTPDANYNGQDSFDFKTDDGELESTVGRVSITVRPIDDPTTAREDVYSIAQDTVLAVPAPGVLVNDTDIDGPLAATLHSASQLQGTVAVSADGSFVFTPLANFDGTTWFTYRASNGPLADYGQARITVTPTPGKPHVTDDSVETAEDEAVTFDAVANDVDPDGDPLRVGSFGEPAHGTLTLNADGTFTYTPAADYYGSDVVTYTVTDGTHTSWYGTISLRVTSVADAPVARPDTFQYQSGAQSVNGDVSANDSCDPEGSRDMHVVSPPPQGTLSMGPSGSFRYDLHGSGSDAFVTRFTYRIVDGALTSNTTTVTLRFGNPPNQAPAANGSAFTTAEDTARSGAVSGSDADGDALTFAVSDPPAHGAVEFASDGTYRYIPAQDYNGPDAFTFTASDGSETSPKATVAITVAAVNDAPRATSCSIETPEDTPKSGQLSGSDVDGDGLTFALVEGVGHGTVELNSDGSYQYRPATDYSGPDSFSFKVNDGTADSLKATVFVNVTAVNDAPRVPTALDPVSAAYGKPVRVTLSGTDSDGDPLAFRIEVPPVGGDVVVEGSVATYTPRAGFSGSDRFLFVANDGKLDSPSPCLVPVLVATEAHPPVAQAGGPYRIRVGEMLLLDGSSSYDPNGAGITSWAWDLDGDGDFLDAFGPQPVIAWADLPVLPSPGRVLNVGLRVTNTAGLTGDSVTSLMAIDPDPVAVADYLPPSPVSVPSYHVARLILDGSASYDRDPGVPIVSWRWHELGSTSYVFGERATLDVAIAPDAPLLVERTFVLDVTDAADVVDSTEFTVVFQIAHNDAPTASGDSLATDEDTQLRAAVRGGDPHGDHLTFAVVDEPANGSVTMNADGTFTYTPKADFNGSDSFTFKASDGSADSDKATIAITVGAVNDKPTATGDSVTTPEDTDLAGQASGADPDGDTLSFAVVDEPANGSVTMNADGTFTYTPKADFNGSDSFTFKASDGTADSDKATIAITVGAVNDKPTATGDSLTTPEDTDLAGQAGGADPDGDALTFAVVDEPANGSVTMNAGGSFTYTPKADFNGSDSFTFKASDGSADSDKATIAITVGAVNDRPEILELSVPLVPVPVNTQISVAATFTDFDISESHIATWTWDDGTRSAASATKAGAVYVVRGTHTYTSAGVYSVAVEVRDSAGATAALTSTQYVVVYDPSAGFVTGGGWIDSPTGAHTPEDPNDPDITGKATFGFVSKYLKGASVPSGETQFQFHAAGLDFKSTSYQYLVISGARAQYKGSGTVNGGGDFGFLLTAVDGQVTGGGGIDRFRIKIWSKATGVVLYDNQPGATDTADLKTAIAGGSIIVHKAK